MSQNDFGKLLRKYRRQSKDTQQGDWLTQERLADLLSAQLGFDYSRGAISEWERGKSHINKDDRAVLVCLISVLYSCTGIQSLEEANELLAKGNYRALDRSELKKISEDWVPTNQANNDSPHNKNYNQKIPFLAPALPPHRIIGRDAILNELAQYLFTNDSLALFALDGLPGVGKTSLAIALAHYPSVMEHFADGILWVGLGREPNIFSKLGHWAQALGIKSTIVANMLTAGERVNAIHDAIGNKKYLLVIDDAWQKEAALAFKLGGPYCAHLVTTRLPEVASQFAGNQAFKVMELSEDDGFELLRHLAPEAVNAEPFEARQLVKSVGGLPLALTLMGNYLRAKTFRGQSRRLYEALQTLKESKSRLTLSEPQAILGSHPSLPIGTHISLQVVIGVSDESLSNSARHALRALAAFPPKPNTWSEAAALAVCAVPEETLDELIDSGLLEISDKDRYTLHQTISDYALETNDDLYSAKERLATFFLTYVEQNKDKYELLSLELINIQGALEIAFEHQQAALLVNGITNVYPYLESRGLYDLAEKYLAFANQLIKSEDATDLEVKILLNMGRLAHKRNNYRLAEEYWQQGLKIAQKIPKDEIAIDLLSGLSGISSEKGDYFQSEGYLQKALALSNKIGDQNKIIRVLYNLGRMAYVREAYGEADNYLQMVKNQAYLDYPDLTCAVLNLWGAVAFQLGNRDKAESLYREGLQLAYETGDLDRASIFLANLGELAREDNSPQKALNYLQEGLKLTRKLINQPRTCHILKDLGLLEGQMGNLEKARKYLDEALAISYLLNTRIRTTDILVNWGETELRFEQWEQAANYFRECLHLGSTLNVKKHDVGIAYYGLSRISYHYGKLSEAYEYAQQSVQAFEETDHYRALELANWMSRLSQEHINAE